MPPTGGYHQPPPPNGGWAVPGLPPYGSYGSVTPTPRPHGGSARTGPLPLYPMNLGDILDAAFRLLRANYKALFVVTFVIAAPVELLGFWAQRNLTNSFGVLSILHTGNVNGTTSTTVNSVPYLESLGFVLLLFVLAPLATGAVCRIVSASYLGEQLTGGQALRLTARRFPALLAASVLIHLCEIAGGILCILPGVAFATLFAASTAIVSLEGSGPLAAMSRSWNLMRRRFWPVLGVVVLAYVLGVIASNALNAVPDALADVVGHPWGFIIAGLGAGFVECFQLALFGAVGTLLLFDARIRFEGLDLEIINQRLNPRS
jgi:hypothetical protein